MPTACQQCRRSFYDNTQEINVTEPTLRLLHHVGGCTPSNSAPLSCSLIPFLTAPGESHSRCDKNTRSSVFHPQSVDGNLYVHDIGIC